MAVVNWWMEDCRVDMLRACLTKVRRRQVRRRKLRAIEVVWRGVVKDGGDDVGGMLGVVGLFQRKRFWSRPSPSCVCVFTE